MVAMDKTPQVAEGHIAVEHCAWASQQLFLCGYVSCIDRHPLAAHRILGNLGQLLDTQGWDFHNEIAAKYGPVVKIHGLFGVSACQYLLLGPGDR